MHKRLYGEVSLAQPVSLYLAVLESLAVYERQGELLERRLGLMKKESQKYEALRAQRFLADLEYAAHQQRLLVAELLLPTRSAGFVGKGDVARLRFDAFPYQRFGFVVSTVERIDKAVMLKGEATLPIALREPVYRVRTRLDTQGIRADGEAFRLRSGMLLEADIILDRRTLLDWLLDPLYSLRGRVG